MVATPRQCKNKALTTYRDGRDEMNLVEFPFATLSERSGGTNVLEFQREAYDRILGKPVVRKLTVTGDAKYGLPTCKDEEVYLALLQLTKLHNDFSEPKVYFTRSQLIRLMGWKNRDWSYHRLGTAFCRLTGVRLFYENAWRDNTKKAYRNQGGFGLLDSFELRDGRVRSECGDEKERLSKYQWSSVLFESFQSGYLKKLDYARAKQLSPIARRLYRYLDKHFHPPHRSVLTLNLKTFAFEHIGVSRRYDSSQIRRALSKPIQELEAVGFLMPNPKRYKKLPGQRGEWEITFTYGTQSMPRNSHRRKPRSSHIPSRPHQKTPDRIDRYLAQLSDSQRKEVEQQAMQQASGYLAETSKSETGPLADECRRQIIRTFLASKLKRPSK